MGHKEIILSTRGGITITKTSSRSTEIDQHEGVPLSMIGWEKVLTHKSSWNWKLELGFQMNNPWFMRVSTATTLNFITDGASEG